MIWHAGKVIAREALAVPINDRVFEHGLGLFETFRSWNGRAPLLARHLERLQASAGQLGIAIESRTLPDQRAVSDLLEATALGGDALLRLTVTGGSASGRAAVAWLSARTLPAPERTPLAVGLEATPIGPFESAVHPHKMLNYWGRRTAFDCAAERGLADVLIVGQGGEILEGARNSLLLQPRGEPRMLLTPAGGPILPGIMCRIAQEFAAGHGYSCQSRAVSLDDLRDAQAVFLTNSVRGVRPVSRIEDWEVETSRQVELVHLLTEKLPAVLSASEPEP
jgi:branched-subunit amino acid aminotransferase/4-amino-4-deoxychorismate lyase